MRLVSRLVPLILITIASASVQAASNIVATTTDLAALAIAVSGEKEVFAIAKGTQDPHQIEAKPSFMTKLRGASLVVAHGLELESAWLDPITRGARNPDLRVFELGPLLDPIEGNATSTRADGDVHPGGNPHFQLDPLRMGKAAMLLAERLAGLDQARKEIFRKNADNLAKRLETRTAEWKARLKKTGVTEVVTYHKTFSYFCARFELKCELQLEPKPGIPPTARHLMTTFAEMKKRGLRVVLVENYFDDSFRAKLTVEVPDARVLKVPVAVEGEAGITTTEDLLEHLITAIEKAVR